MSSLVVESEFDSGFIDKFDHFIFDADGVLWLGRVALPGALRFLHFLVEKGKNVFLATNNSTRTHEEYFLKLKNLGFNMIPKKHVVCPLNVLTNMLVAKKSNLPVYLISAPSVQKELMSVNIPSFGVGEDTVDKYLDGNFIFEIDATRPVQAVVVSYDVHISYAKIMRAVNYIHQPGVEFIATNEDATLPGPIPGVILPGAGTNVKAIETASGKRPLVIGKPSPLMFLYIRDNFGVVPERAVMFGDRCDTDIMFGHNAGISTVLVGTGVHNMNDVNEFKSKNLHNLIPQYFCPSLEFLYESLTTLN